MAAAAVAPEAVREVPGSRLRPDAFLAGVGSGAGGPAGAVRSGSAAAQSCRRREAAAAARTCPGGDLGRCSSWGEGGGQNHPQPNS